MTEKDKKDFHDRVFGCWLGKCIGGNIGAPYEGMKQRMDLKYTPEFLENMLPNDDLDLQILWLDLLEEKGLDATVADYAAAFNERCDYAPGEYAFFRKNYRKGIMPPLSGSFNNEYFNEGMGAPIRSELWACLFPQKPKIAAEYASRDASADHCADGESAHGEMFLAALESLCFCGGSVREHIVSALDFIPSNCKLYAALSDVICWCDEFGDINKVLNNIIRDYGHSESAMVHQNISITVAALLLHSDSFTDAVMAAVNCGFDTDCTGASVGAVMGILAGGKEVTRVCGVSDAEYKLGVRSPRKDLSVSALSRSVCALAERLPVMPRTHGIGITQEGYPAIGFGETALIPLRLHTDTPLKNAAVKIKLAKPLISERDEFTADITDGELLKIFVHVPENAPVLPEAMPCEISINGKTIGKFGLSGKRRWLVSGPYWKNNVLVPELKAGESYWKYIPGEGDEFMDVLRCFHISALPDENACLAAVEEDLRETVVADTAEDIVRLTEHTGFFGNAAYIFSTEFDVKSDCTAGLQIGRNTPIRVWLNGELIAERNGNEIFYHECIHKLNVKLKEGVNRLEFMVVKNSDDTKFSYEFLRDGVCSDHLMFDIVNSATVAASIERRKKV